jgi:hypothetical protein
LSRGPDLVGDATCSFGSDDFVQGGRRCLRRRLGGYSEDANCGDSVPLSNGDLIARAYLARTLGAQAIHLDGARFAHLLRNWAAGDQAAEFQEDIDAHGWS